MTSKSSKGDKKCPPTSCKGLTGAEAIVEIIANQAHRDPFTAKHLGLVDLLIRRGDRHENHAFFLHLCRYGDALGVISRTCAYKHIFIGLLAHRVVGAPQLVGPHGRQVRA